MKVKVNRVILDTNLWISFLITNDFRKLDELINSRQSIIVFNDLLLDEFLTVAGRPKFSKFFSPEDINDLLSVIVTVADFVNVVAEVNVCRDPKDNFLLALAIDGQANYLLTGDGDLLELEEFAGTKIRTITDFLKEEGIE